MLMEAGVDPRVKPEEDGGWVELCGKYSDCRRHMEEFRFRRCIESFEVEDVAVRFTTALFGNIPLQPCGLVNRAVFFQGFKQNPGKPLRLGNPAFIDHETIEPLVAENAFRRNPGVSDEKTCDKRREPSTVFVPCDMIDDAGIRASSARKFDVKFRRQVDVVHSQILQQKRSAG